MRIIGNPLFKKIGLAVERDLFHERKGVALEKQLRVPELHQEPIRDKTDIVLHEVGIHTNQSHREALADEFLLDNHSLVDDDVRLLDGDLVIDVRIQQDGKIRVQPLVPRDPLIRFPEGLGHETPLLQPEDGAEAPTKEQALDYPEGEEPLCKTVLRLVDPAQRPVRLLGDARDLLDRVKEGGLPFRGRDEGVDHEAVGLAVYVFHHRLERVEASGLGDRDLAAEILDQVF